MNINFSGKTVLVAGGTGGLSRERNGPLADIVQRGRSVVTILAEVLRHQRGTQDQKCSESRKKHEDQR